MVRHEICFVFIETSQLPAREAIELFGLDVLINRRVDGLFDLRLARFPRTVITTHTVSAFTLTPRTTAAWGAITLTTLTIAARAAIPAPVGVAPRPISIPRRPLTTGSSAALYPTFARAL
jgi:hypothetical protein